MGFRFFVQRVAERLHVSGYTRNLRDGRVEVFAIGSPAQLIEMKAALGRGPRFSTVSEVREETAQPDHHYESQFVIEQDA